MKINLLALGLATVFSANLLAGETLNVKLVPENITVELDGVHIVHLGDIGHLLTEDKLTDIGPIDVACIPIGGVLQPNKAAELIAQLDAKVVVPMPVCDDAEAGEALAKFLHEMGVSAAPAPQSKLALMPSSVPAELTMVLLEQRGKVPG